MIVLQGELDVATAPELEKYVNEVLAEDHARVLVDLNELSFVDSAGVSALIRAKKKADSNGRRLVLRRPTAQLESVVAVVGLAEWMAFED